MTIIKIIRRIVSLFCSLIFVVAIASPSHSANQIPKYINFQGQLTDSSGAKVNGNKSVTFAIYNVSSGGSPLYSEAQTLTLSNGVGSALIGSITALTLPFDTQYYLGVTIAGDAEMTPRVQLSATAYAFTAQELADSAVAQGTLAVTDTLAVGSTRLVVTSAGRVGIGTATPSEKLHVSGNVIADSININGGISVEGEVAMIGGKMTVGKGGAVAGNLKVVSTTGRQLTLDMNDTSDATISNTFGSITLSPITNVVLSQGKLGIGTSNPSESIHVAGGIRADTMTITNSIYATTYFGSGSGLTGVSAAADTSITGSFSVDTPTFLVRSDSRFVGFGVVSPEMQVQIGKAAAPMSITSANMHLHIGGTEFGANSYRLIGFGYMDAGRNYIPAYMGYKSVNAGGSTYGDLIFGARNSGNDIEPPERMRITGSGHVGIGTSAPNDSLTVAGSVHISDTLSVDSVIYASRYYGDGSQLTGIAAGSGPDTDWTVDSSGNVVRTTGKIGIGTASPTDSLHVAGTMRVIQNNAAGTFVVDATGQVGIGTASPGAILEITGGTPRPRITWNNTANYGSLLFRENATTVGALQGLGSAFADVSRRDAIELVSSINNNGYISFWTKINGTDSEKVRITNAGSLGIGTATPSDSLHVAGTVRIADSLVVSDTVFVVDHTTGRVGIGTTAPVNGLELKNSGIRLPILGLGGSLEFSGSTTRIHRNGNALEIENQQTLGAGIKFKGAGGSQKMEMTPWGHLGINVTSPADSLSVKGSARFESLDGAQFLVFDSRIGIGTATPGDSIHIVGTVKVSDSLVVADTVLVVNHRTGRVGIGTTAPGRTLDVVRVDGAADVMGINNSNSTYAKLIRYGDGTNFFMAGLSNAADGNQFHFRKSDSVTVLNIAQTGNVGIGIGTANPSDSLHVKGRGRFEGRAGGETIYFVDTGIGIGEAAPNVTNGTYKALLHIKSSDNPGIVLQNTGGGKTYLHTHSDGSFSIMNDNNGGEPFHILNNNAVGINTITPTDSLTVGGTMKVSDTLLVGETTTTKDIVVTGQLLIQGGSTDSGKILVSDNAGKATFQAPIGVRVRKSINQSIADSAQVAINFDVEDLDSGNLHNNGQQSRLTATAEGIYMINGSVSFQGNGTGVRQIFIRRNGSDRIATGGAAPVAGTFSNDGSVATTYYLGPGDYVELVVLQTSGGALNVLSLETYSPVFSMVKIR